MLIQYRGCNRKYYMYCRSCSLVMSKRGAGRPPLRTIMSPVVTLAMKQVGQVVRELHMSRNRNSKEAGLNLFRLEELEKRMCNNTH